MAVLAMRKQAAERSVRVALVLVAIGVPAQAPAQDVDVARYAPLEELVAEAVADYPAILSEWAEVDAMRTVDAQVSQPFDPMATIGILNLPIDSFAFDDHMMSNIMFGVSERFYWPGALDTRADEARARAEARQARIPETVIRIWMAAVGPYTRLLELDRALRVLEERRAVLTDLRDAARARYEARAVPLTDVLRVDTQISRVSQDIAAVSTARRVAVADLNGLLDREAGAPIAVAAPDEPTSLEGGVDDWLARAVENRPAFASLDARRRLIGAQRLLAEAEDDPVWSLGLSYSLRFQEGDPGTDLVSLTWGITLPFFSANRTDARLDELVARSMQVDFDRDELVRQLRADIGTHLEAMASLIVEIAVIDDELIPSVESTYESAIAHFASSHMSVETLIEIQDRLLELDLARTRLVSQHDMHRARLRALTVDSEAIRQILWSEP